MSAFSLTVKNAPKTRRESKKKKTRQPELRDLFRKLRKPVSLNCAIYFTSPPQ
jgi:hypothetical protein